MATLRSVAKTDTFEIQRQIINSLGQDVFNAFSGIDTSFESITVTDDVDYTYIYPSYVETSTLFLDSNQSSSITSSQEGLVSFQIDGAEQSGYSSYGLFSTKNLTVYSVGITDVTIDDEGNEYVAGIYPINVVTNPSQVATATAVLDTDNGSLKNILLTNFGANYTLTPNVSIQNSTTGNNAVITAILKSYGPIIDVIVNNGGSGYTSPTATFTGEYNVTFSVSGDVDSTNDYIISNDHEFEDGDQIVYVQNGSVNIGLTNGSFYYIVNSTQNTFKLSSTLGGSAINLTQGGSLEFHTIKARPAEVTVNLISGSVDSVTINFAGVKYSNESTIIINDPTGSNVDLSLVIGKSIDSLSISDAGNGYDYIPLVSITPDANDLYGSGASATAELGYPIKQINLIDSGLGYAITPIIVFDGGTPVEDASPEIIFDKKTGKITEVNIPEDLGGFNYSSAPTITFVGGRGQDAVLNVTVLPFEGNIDFGGSGYLPGVYENVILTGGSPLVEATATLTVAGLSGSISSPGSNYTNGEYQLVPIINPVTNTYAVTSQLREVVLFAYSGEQYEWNVVDNGSNTAYNFTLVSPSGTASGSNISITAEVNDTLTFNVNAPGHPFFIQSTPAPASIESVIVTGIQNNGTDSGTIVWNLSQIEPGTYYYVCGNHPSMTGTITVSAYSGATFSVSDTITGSISNASGVSTFVDNNFVRFATVTNGPFSSGEIITNGTASATVTSISTENTIFIDGVESPIVNLDNHNTYRFDISDSSLVGFSLNNFEGTDATVNIFGNLGNPDSYLDLILPDTLTPQNNIFSYGFQNSGNVINVLDGSSDPGVYGYNATASITVISGQVTNFEFENQGTGYKIGDTLEIEDLRNLGGTGSGFEFTISSFDTSISTVTNISSSGGPYTLSDVLTVDPNFDGIGNGSGFVYSLTKTGFVSSVQIANPGFGYATGEQITILNPPETNGSEFIISVTDTEERVPIEVRYDGGITALNWNVNTNGNSTFNNINGQIISSSSISNSGAINTGTLTAQTSISTNAFNSSTAVISSSLAVGQASIASNGNLTTSGIIKSTTGGFNSNDDLTIINSIIATTTGNQLVLDPAIGQTVKVDATTAFVVPVGLTSDRPSTPESGSIRFNSEISQFEGYDGNNEEWVSVGGVKDVDGNTYIAAESVPGANENILYFYNDDINTLNVTTTSIDLEGVNVLNANNASGLEVNGNVNIKDNLTFDTVSEGRILLDDGTVLIPSLSFVDQERTGLILTDGQTALSVTSTSGQIAEFGSTELSVFRNTTFNKLAITATSFTAGSGYTQGQYNTTSFEGGTGNGLTADITIAFEVNVSTAGLGYDIATYENIALDTTSGTGSGAIATIVVDGTTGVAEVTITDSGNGQYQVGDTISTTYTNMTYDDGQGNQITTAQPTTDFEFTVTAVGAITVLNITTDGEGYRDLDVLTVPTAVIGAGIGFELTIDTTTTTEEVAISKDDGSITSKSLAITTTTGIDINGDLSINNTSVFRTTAGNLQLTTQSGSFVQVTGTGALLVPSGTTAQRPGNALAGAIRYNTSESRFEGFNGSFFVSLGGVRDVDGNTYISAELNPGDNDNILRFVNDDVQSMQVEQNKITLQSINNLEVTNLIGVTEWEAGASVTAPADPINDPPVLIYFGTNVYSVDSTGTFDATNSPNHTSGLETNGTVDLTWVRTIYQDLNYIGKNLNLNLQKINLNLNSLLFSGDSTSAHIDTESTDLLFRFTQSTDPFIKISDNGSLSINNGFGSTESYIQILDKDLQQFDLKDTRIYSATATIDTSVGNAVNIPAFPYTESYSGRFIVEITDDSPVPRKQYSELSYLVKSDGSDILYTENNKIYTDEVLCDISMGIDGSDNVTVDVVDVTLSTSTVYSIKIVSQVILV
jgi:plastocyanin